MEGENAVEAVGDVDEGVGCRGLAWVVPRRGVWLRSEPVHPLRRRAAVIEPSRGGGTNPAA